MDEAIEQLSDTCLECGLPATSRAHGYGKTQHIAVLFTGMESREDQEDEGTVDA